MCFTHYDLFIVTATILDDWGESIQYKFESIHLEDDSCQIWLKLARWFQRFFKKFTSDERHQVMAKVHMTLWIRLAKNHLKYLKKISQKNSIQLYIFPRKCVYIIKKN